ncbi:uncharacterized protein LOC112992615 [Dromaius novaehollandiae]|uniref:uncharacterized protein LOC112992615 n=1 Tax=Dromaius novaehollandiae TaxID=8790 RepID=UPI00311F9EB7
MSPFRSRCGSTKRSRNSSTVKLEIKLQESDDEYDLVIDVPPLTVNKKPRITRNCENCNKEEKLAAIICAEKLHASDIANSPSKCTVEKSEEMVTLQKNGRDLNKSKKLDDVSPEISKIYLPDVNIKIPKVSDNLKEKRNALAYSKEKCMSSAICIEADMQKEILKQKNAETNMLVEASVQGHSTNENCLTSKRAAQSVLNTDYSSKDETVLGDCKETTVNTGKIQSIEENKGNDIVEDTYPHLTDYLNVGKEACHNTGLTKRSNKKNFVETACANKESEMTVFSSSSEEMESSEGDTELSESDDPIEECRRIFYEFEREAQNKGDKQVLGGNMDLDLLETKVNVPGQKKRIAHTAKFEVHTKKEIVPFRASSPQQGDNMRIQQEAMLFTAAGKNEQAFVATTSRQKKTTSELSTTEVQSIGPMGMAT